MKAFEKNFNGENSYIPHLSLSLSDRHKVRDIFVPMGTVLEHMLCILGTIPSRFCRNAILAMAGECEVDEELLLEDFFYVLAWGWISSWSSASSPPHGHQLRKGVYFCFPLFRIRTALQGRGTWGETLSICLKWNFLTVVQPCCDWCIQALVPQESGF